MGSEGTPPKLSLLISRHSKPPEMPTPPLQTGVSVPFQWEEAPGKPRPCPTESKPRIARTLELPPRLLFSEAKVSNAPSPTTVLDGPYLGRAMSFTSSYRTRRSRSKEHWNGNFGSSRWRSLRGNKDDEVEGSFDFSNCPIDGYSSDVRSTKVKITRVRSRSRRRGSFFSGISQTRSLWVSLLPCWCHNVQFTTLFMDYAYCCEAGKKKKTASFNFQNFIILSMVDT